MGGNLQGFGYQDDVLIGNRKFKVHSGYHPETESTISEVFEEGHFLFKAISKYPLRVKRVGYWSGLCEAGSQKTA